MKKRIVLILAIGIMGLAYDFTVFSSCPPTWSVISDTAEHCPTQPSRSKTWEITWQDGNTETQSNVGNGKCGGVITTTECAPNFEEPYTVSQLASGRRYEQWRQTTYDRR